MTRRTARRSRVGTPTGISAVRSRLSTHRRGLASAIAAALVGIGLVVVLVGADSRWRQQASLFVRLGKVLIQSRRIIHIRCTINTERQRLAFVSKPTTQQLHQPTLTTMDSTFLPSRAFPTAPPWHHVAAAHAESAASVDRQSPRHPDYSSPYLPPRLRSNHHCQSTATAGDCRDSAVAPVGPGGPVLV